jgi:hypothetical protein
VYDSGVHDAIYSDIRKALLAVLRRVAFIQNSPERNQQLQTYDLARQLAQDCPTWPRPEIWRAIYEMFTEGILVPVAHIALRNPHTEGMMTLWQLPAYSITDYGMRYIESTKDQPDPYDATTILEPLRVRSIANDTVEAYIPEAVRALGARAYRGVFVLMGVAAEAVSEDLYDALEQHLPMGQRAPFRQALNVKKMSAEARWEAFTSRFPQKHAGCIGDELTRRFTNILEPQLKLFKHNRDDAAHRRATLIGLETAQAAISSFVPFAITAADMIEALKMPCVVPP